MELPNPSRSLAESSPAEATQSTEAQVLPTMDDLDRLAADLDQVDATLASLDREVAGAEPSSTGSHD